MDPILSTIISLMEDKNIKIEKFDGVICLRDDFSFKIIIKKRGNKLINMFYNWNIGYIGKCMLGKKYNEMIKIIATLKNEFKKRGYKVVQVVEVSS